MGLESFLEHRMANIQLDQRWGEVSDGSEDHRTVTPSKKSFFWKFSQQKKLQQKYAVGQPHENFKFILLACSSKIGPVERTAVMKHRSEIREVVTVFIAFSKGDTGNLL